MLLAIFCGVQFGEATKPLLNGEVGQCQAILIHTSLQVD